MSRLEEDPPVEDQADDTDQPQGKGNGQGMGNGKNEMKTKNTNNNNNNNKNDNDIEMDEGITPLLSVEVVKPMYEMKQFPKLPTIQFTQSSIIPNTTPMTYQAFVMDKKNMMPVIIHPRYTEDIYYGRLKNNDIITVYDWEMSQMNAYKVIKINDLKKIGSLPPYSPTVAITMKYATYGMHKPAIDHKKVYNSNNNNNNNNNNNVNSNTGGTFLYNPKLMTGGPSGYANSVDPLGSNESVHARMKKRNQGTGIGGYNPFKTFNPHANLPSNDTVTTSGQPGVSKAAADEQKELLDQIKAANQNTNSNSNSNSNNNNNSNSNSNNNDTAAPSFQNRDFMKEINEMIHGSGVPNATHSDAPADRQLPLNKGLKDTILPQIMGAGNMNQEQAEHVYNIIHSQSLKMPVQQQPKNDGFDIHQFLQQQRQPQVKALS